MRILLSVALLTLVALPASAQGIVDEDGVYVVVDEAPGPVGGLAALTRQVVYPESALEDGAEGTAIVTLVVGPEGNVLEATVARAPHPALGQASLEAVERVDFTPGRVDGEAVTTRVSFPIRFRLPDLEADYADQPAEPLGGWGRVLDAVVWPPQARRVALEGTVAISVDVDAQGRVTDVDVRDMRQENGEVRSGVTVMRVESSSAGVTSPPPGVRPNTGRFTDLYRGLEEAIRVAVEGAQFTPEIRNGEAVAGTASAIVPFIAD